VPILDVELQGLENLKKAMDDIGLAIEDQQKVIQRAINEGVDRVSTQIKRGLTEWAGANRQTQIKNAMSKRVATITKGSDGLSMEGAAVVKDKYAMITGADFNAVATASHDGMPGVTHTAWGRPGFATKAFMMNGIDVAFKRVGPKKGQIKALYGPNMAREVARHQPQVQKMLDDVLPIVAAEAFRQIGIVADQAKAKHKL
jgi:hypothetical protein